MLPINRPTAFRVFSWLLALVFVPGALGAQPAQLKGVWRGTITTEYQGQRSGVPVEIEFGDEGKAVLTMSESNPATYSYAGDKISVNFENSLLDDFSLYDIKIDKASLSAKLKFNSDIEGVTSAVNLSKLNDSPKTMMSAVSVGSCSDPQVPPDVQDLLRKYQLSCPLDVKADQWYKAEYVKGFLEELADGAFRKALGSPSPFPFVGYVVSFTDGRFHIDFRVPLEAQAYHFDSYQKADSFLKDILPRLFRIPTSFTLGWDPYCIICTGSNTTYSTRELKKEFLVGGDTVDYDSLWGVVKNASESGGLIRLDKDSEGRDGQTRRIKSYWRKLGVDKEGYAYWEQVKIDMSGSGNLTNINVISVIIRRKGYSSTQQNIECAVPFGEYMRNDLMNNCSEGNLMKAITNAIKR